MAANLRQAGYRVTGYDPVPAAQDAAAGHGITPATTPAAAVEGAEVVITMLPGGALVLELYAELLPAAGPDTLFIDCSTIDVADARQAGELATAAGHRALDAPVSGGEVGAEAGTLAFMVGGADADVAQALPLLETMGRKIVHCGGSGNGQAAKVCNNMILGVSMLAVSEAFVLGERLGLSHQALYDVAANASGQCWSLTTNCPVPGPVPTSPANRDYVPGFATGLMNKDLGLASNAVQNNGVAAELGLHTAELYRRFAESGGAGYDFSAIINDVRNRSTAEEQK